MISHSFNIPGKEIHQSVVNLTPHKPKYLAGSENHKRHIFQSNLKWSDWKMGDEVEVNNHHVKSAVGWIVDCLTPDQFESVEWDGLKPRFIEVYLNAIQDSVLCHPSDLTFKGK